MPTFVKFAILPFVSALHVEDDTSSLLQLMGVKSSDRDVEVEQKLVQRSQVRNSHSHLVNAEVLGRTLWGKNPTEDKTETLPDGRTRSYTCELSMVGKCFKGSTKISTGPSPAPRPGSPAPSVPSPGPSSPSPASGVQPFPQTSKFANGQKSMITGETFSQADEVEQKIAEELNRVRRQGFTCAKSINLRPEKSARSYAPAEHDLVLDCRLWWASKLHSQDMAVRKYYSHYTKAGSYENQISGNAETLTSLVPHQRCEQWAWGMPCHVEIIVAYPETNANISDVTDYAEKVVQAWLASPDHCHGIGTAANQLVGVGGAWCPKSGQDSVCKSMDQNDADGTGRMYWTALFTYTLPAADEFVDENFSPLASVAQPTPPIQEIGGDTSCER